jgi:hypothetical protein
MRLTVALALATLASACRPSASAAPDPRALDPIARRYVVLGLNLGHSDPNYVDAYYGPDSLKAVAAAESLSVPQVRAAAESLVAVLGDSVPAYPDSLARMRHRYLRVQLGSMVARARMLMGEKLSFDQEAEALYDATPPHYSDAHFDSLLARLDTLLPGKGPLAGRYQRFRDRLNIPAAKVDTVFKTAIAACRARTLAHIPLPPGERFDLEYVKGTSWNAYNWYKGQYHSLIQVNLDFPVALDRAIDLACHEGYPGHHVYNALLEKHLVKDRGWVEFSVYPLFSPQSLIAEGTANYGIEVAFPGDERTAFERASLYPLAGLDPATADAYARVQREMHGLDYGSNEAARRYLEGRLDAAAAAQWLTTYALMPPDRARQRVTFIEQYRSYVLNYNLGQDLVRAYVEKQAAAGDRWKAFKDLLASPRLPSGLK